jgi:hypothetical protein
MKTGLKILVVIAFAVIFGFSLAGCKDSPDENLVENPIKPDPIIEDPTDPDFVTDLFALRPVPVASSSTSTPIVVGSYSDGDRNYYLIDVGYIRNVYVSTAAIVHYNGMTPMSFSRTLITENTVTNALTKTASDSITISDTQSRKTSVETAYENSIPFAGTFSAKLGVEWERSWNNTNTYARSTETSVSTTIATSETTNISFTVGENGEPAGWHRYALYAVCDVYFIISTSLNNQDLKSWDTVVCVRDDSYIPHWDFSPDGIFDNSPIGEITFSEDFYKILSPPTGEVPVLLPPNFQWTDWKTIRTDAITITDSGRFNQHADIVNFFQFKIEESEIDLNVMRQQGYKTISFYIRLDVREIDDAWEYIFLFNSPTKSNDYLISTVKFEHGPGYKDTNWRTHYEDELKFENISIDKFMKNEFVIRYGASGNGSNDWRIGTLKINLLFQK